MNPIILWWQLWQLNQPNHRARCEAAGALGRGADKRAVEALLKALENDRDKDPGLRVLIISALGEIGDARAVRQLAARLEFDPDREAGYVPGKMDIPLAEGIEAARALGKIGSARAVEALIRALKNADRSLRAAVIDALAKTGDARAIEPLLAVLPEEDQAIRTAHILPALDRLLALHPERSNRMGAAYWIAKENWNKCVEIGAPAVVPLIAELKKGNLNAAAALGRIGDNRAVAPLVETLQGARGSQAARLIDGLVKIGSSQAIEPLAAMLKTNDLRVREAAAEGLEKLGYQPDRGETGAYFWIAKQDWYECIEIGGPAVEPLTGLLAQEDRAGPSAHMICEYAAVCLGKIGDARAVRALIPLLDHRDKAASLAGAQALTNIGHPAVEPLLEALSTCTNEGSFQNMVKLLGKIGDAGAAKRLGELLLNEYEPSAPGGTSYEAASKNKRYAMVAALGKIGDPAAIPGLTAALREYDDLYEPCVWIGASEALAGLGEPAIQALDEILEDKREEQAVRLRAAETLGKINHPRAQLVFGVYARLKKTIHDREDLVLEYLPAALARAEQGRDFKVRLPPVNPQGSPAAQKKPDQHVQQ